MWIALPKPVSAAPAIEIISPMPNSIVLVNTEVAFEVEISSGDAGRSYTVEWQLNWDGNEATKFTGTSFKSKNIGQRSTFPVQYRDPDFVWAYDQATDTQRYLVRVVDDNNEAAEAQGALSVTGGLALNGFAYIGASTARCTTTNAVCQTDADCGTGQCGGDPLGWISLQNTTCADAATYSVGVDSPVSGGGAFTRLIHNGWTGNTSGANCSEQRPIGPLTFNSAQCSDTGNWCEDANDCSLGASCLATGAPPSSYADADGENWAAYKELNHFYTTTTDFSRSEGGTTYASQRYPGQIAGWSRFLTQKDYGESELGRNDLGWLHLRGPEAPAPNVNPPFYSFVAAKGFHGCTDCTTSGAKCNICTQVQLNPPDDESAWATRSCNSCYTCLTDPDTQDTACDRCERCDAYGVSMNTQTSELTGYGWSGDFGWVRFTDISVIQAWLATRYGDIFSGGSITTSQSAPAPFGESNATYIIQANGNVDFRSKADLVQPSYPTEIALPKAANRYINVLGRLDFDELTLATSQNQKTHRYGTTIGFADFSEIPNALGGTIYYHQGSLTVDDARVFQPGTPGVSGAGTIIVDGNLTINANMTHQSGPSGTELKNIPSLAWLVRGNLNISGDVSQLDGAFFVLGCQGVAGCPNGATDDGVVDTGASLNTALTVNGLMMAQRFNFRRAVNNREGSEQILYDGRFLANPPPGLQDLSAVLPQIREVIP